MSTIIIIMLYSSSQNSKFSIPHIPFILDINVFIFLMGEYK